MKIRHRHNLETKLTLCINSIIELTVTYFKKNFNGGIKTCYDEVNVVLAEGPEWVQNPDLWIPVHGRRHIRESVTLPKVLPYFAHCSSK